jgi:tetratricopeptide (TPR) repeat protein
LRAPGFAVSTYGQTLLKLADRQPAPVAAAGLHLNGFRNLRARIGALRNTRRLPAFIQAVAVVSCTAAALTCAGIGEDAEDPEDLARRCEQLKVEATVAHDESEKQNDQKLRFEAVAAYDDYADTCSSDPDYGEVMYYRAEAMWAIAVTQHAAGETAAATGTFHQAHDAFNEALDTGGATRYTKDAAYAQLLAKKNELAWEEEDRPKRSEVHEGEPVRSSGEAKFPRSDYSVEERQILAAYATYGRFVDDPEDKEWQKAQYQRAKLAMKHNRFDEARPVLEQLLQTSDGTEFHVWSAEMLLDLLTIAWVDPNASLDAQRSAALQLQEWMQRMERADWWSHEEATQIRGAVPALRAGIQWKSAMGAHERGDHEACAEGFLKIADAHPEHEKMDAILYNAARCLDADGDKDKARELWQRIVRTYPDTERAHKARELLSR